MLKFSLCLFIFSSLNLFSQSINVSLSAGIDTTSNLKKNEVFHLWDNYVNSKPDSIYDNPYWNKFEKNKYVCFDLLNCSGFLSPSLFRLVYGGYKNVVLSISPYGSDYVIKSMFYFPYPDGTIYPLAIVNYVAKLEGNNYKLYNYMPQFTKNWQHNQIGFFNYIYHPNHPFDIYKAKNANEYYNYLCKAFSIKPDTLTYYIAQNCDNIFKTQGFDFVVGMGSENNLCGFYDSKNKIIYSNTVVGEDYYHEITHILLDKLPNSGIFHLGLTVYWGGEQAHLGKPLIFHIQRVNNYLKEHPEIDLSDFENSFAQMDEYTSPHYIIAAIFCHLAIKQGGFEKLKRLLSYGSDNTYYAIEKEFRIPQKNLNRFLRKEIEYFATHGIQPIFP